MPSQDDLRSGSTVGGRNGRDDRVGKQRAASEAKRTPRLRDDSKVGVELKESRLREVRMEFDLIDRRYDPGRVDDRFQV
jgi:hypothetical protein